MPLNSLVSQAGLKLGPLVLETLVKHYFERILKERGDGATKLSRDELLYDEAFHIIKTFLEASTKHSVEELQEFSNTRTPSPPWTHVVRLLVPMSSCDDAATYLINALGGEEVTKRVVGGTKWWQVRGVKGVDAEWITAKKDWEKAKQREKAHEKERSSDTRSAGPHRERERTDASETPAAYQPEMDTMPCILFAHGGGYYFGSIDQERYSIERYARKIKGRVFAINYRLAPQYPFPCAIQDFLAAYLFLIRPPEGASHRPVDPAKIVVAGDSAGGGLCIALLQVIRDVGLPMPAGGVLISPWCDLTHSFPSVHVNNATDVLPPYGLSFHKPSTLWPPPADELTVQVHNGIRSRVREVFHMSKEPASPGAASRAVEESAPADVGVDHKFVVPSTGQTLHLGSTTSLPQPSHTVRDQTITLRATSGEVFKIEEQLQMYTPNYLLAHPLVSPAVSYMGGLPPLLFIASEKEVLRDEIIYIAHKAAHPHKHHVKEEARKMYPALEGIENRFGPTKVHLQVYDDAAHTLPTLFSFTTPAKYCYRAIATFCKFATGILSPLSPTSPVFESTSMYLSPIDSAPSLPSSPSPHQNRFGRSSSLMPPSNSSSSTISGRAGRSRLSTSGGNINDRDTSKSSKRTMRRAVSMSVTRASSLFHRGAGPSSPGLEASAREASEASDVAGPRFGDASPEEDAARMAGEPSVYDNGLDEMIRERVSTNGVIRPLEPEEELPALQFPEELIGEISELVVRRYSDGREKFGKKFAKVSKSIEKKRRRNLARAHNDTMRNMAQLQMYISQDDSGAQDSDAAGRTPKGIHEGLISAGSWPWAWALDVDEAPPPSSIVARRDTEEARRLAKIADQAFMMDEHAISGNNLWSVIVEFLTKTPDKHKTDSKRGHARTEVPAGSAKSEGKEDKNPSRFARFVTERRKGQQSTKPSGAE